jgi:hypothetical protein
MYYKPEVKFRLRDPDFSYDTSYLEYLAPKLKQLYFSEDKIELYMSGEQRTQLETRFSTIMDELNDLGIDDSGLITRGALILMKIAAVLTLLEVLENNEATADHTNSFSKTAFDAAITIQVTSLVTSLNIAKHYQSRQKPVSIPKSYDLGFLDKLPDIFTRKDALKAMPDVPIRTADRTLDRLTGKAIQKTDRGRFVKLPTYN